MTIRNRLVLGLGLIVTLSTVGGILFVGTFQRSYRETLEVHASLISSQIRSQIETTLSLHKDHIVMASRDSGVLSLLQDSGATPQPEGEVTEEIRRNLVDYYELRYGSRLFTSVELFDMTGRRRLGVDAVEDSPVRNTPWWNAAVQEGFSVDHVLSSSQEDRVTIRLSVLVRNRQNEPIGVLTGRLDFSVLLRSSELYVTPFRSTVTTVVSEDGRLLYRSTPFVLHQDVSDENYIASMDRDAGVIVTGSGGRSRLNAYSTLYLGTARDGEPWHVIVSYSLEEALQGIVSARRQLTVFVLALLVLSVAVSLWVYRSIRRPLDLLTEAVGRVGRRELDFRHQWHGTDEVSMVIRRFDRMREKLQYFYNDMAREVEHQRQQRVELEAIAGSDELTHLFNRRAFLDFLEHRIEECGTDSTVLAVIYLDLNGFKPINDIHGHQMGDYVLKTIGRRLIDATREGDLAARVGGDEFAVVLASVFHTSDAEEAAWRLVAAISDRIEKDGLNLSVGVSAGMSSYPTGGTSPAELIEHAADRAMYRAKRSLGDGRVSSAESAFVAYDAFLDGD
ncbi:MAG: diguanylate cyclase [Alkalispirochaeta sp.]